MIFAKTVNLLCQELPHVNELTEKKTGGSTGVPLQLYWSKEAALFKQAATIRHNSWAGYIPGNRIAVIWGADNGSDSLRAKLYNFLISRIHLLDTLEMSEQKMLEFAHIINRYKIKTIMGHAHSIYIFAHFISETKLAFPSVSGIITTAEVLIDTERRKIENVFGCSVFNRYGCEELSIIASECDEKNGLHINAEGVFVEVVAEKKDEPGELILTDLVNYSMPFIRYKIEDMAILEDSQCACGRQLPLIKKLHGRTADFLYTPEGKMLSGISIMDHFAIEIPGIWQVQLIQKEIKLYTY